MIRGSTSKIATCAAIVRSATAIKNDCRASGRLILLPNYPGYLQNSRERSNG